MLNYVLAFSDDRSVDVFKTRIEAATQMKAVMGADPRPNCLVIDEIDGAPQVRAVKMYQTCEELYLFNHLISVKLLN